MSQIDAAMQKGFAGTLGNASSGLSTEATNPQAPYDVTATAMTVSSSISSLNLGTLIPGVRQASSKHSDGLQAALEQHWENTLHLLRMGPASGKPTVPLKMLHKIRAVNMKTMTKVNPLTSHAGKGDT
jgi:hypothetical protein